jgi:hypothetical protein
MKAVLLGALALVGVAATPASAMPVDRLNAVENSNVQSVAVVCRHGRCWRTYRHAFVPRIHRGYRYGRYHRGYRAYGYHRRPGITFRLGGW